MIETLTIITLCILFLAFFRPGKTPPLNNPLVIDRPGKYHVTLAPHLNLAQPLVEAIALQLLASPGRSGDSSTQYFEVRDKQVTSHGNEAYLLAITQRDGILYFQAAAPADDNDHLKTIGALSQHVLRRFPLSDVPDAAIDREISSTAQQAASLRRIALTQIL